MDFRKSKLNLAEVQKADELAGQAKDKVFKEGMYDCQVTEAEIDDKYPPFDPTWRGLKITLVGAGDKKAYGKIEFPTERTEYIKDGKNWFFKFNEFKAAAIGFGMAETDDLGEFIDRVFVNKGILNMNVKVQFSYPKGFHAKYINENTFHLIDEKAVPFQIDDKVVSFPTREACEVFCKQKGLKYQPWPRPSQFFLAEQPKKKSEPKKAPKVVDEPPF